MLQALSWAALGTGFTFLMTTLGAAVVFFFVEEPRPQFQRTMLGFAAGVMTAASVWSLLLPAIEQSADFGVPGWLPAAAGLLLGAAGLLGGTIQALSGATGSKATGLLLGTLAIPLLSAAMIRASRMRRDVQNVRVRMTYKKRTARFSAVVDSGNCLRDYLTHRPVIVIPQACGNRLFGLEDTPLRPIFADTAGGRQMMFCLTPERTILCDGRNEWAVEAMLALSPGLGGNAPALLPASLLNRKDGQEGA